MNSYSEMRDGRAISRAATAPEAPVVVRLTQSRPVKVGGRVLVLLMLVAASVGAQVLWSNSSPAAHEAQQNTITRLRLLQATADACPAVENGVDYVGNDIGAVLGSNAGECCTACAQRRGCGAFTWSTYGGGTCWLKNGKGATAAKASVVSAVLATPAPPVTDTTCPSVENNVDYVGNDLANVAGSGASDCCTKCSQRTGCGAFTWSNYMGGTCWLKTGKGTTASVTGVVSAVLGSPSTPSTSSCSAFETGVDYLGNDIGSVAGTGASDCCAKCAQRAGCGAFTWSDYNGGTCWLKRGKSATASKGGVVSGLVQSGTATLPPTPAPTSAPVAQTTCPDISVDKDYVGNDLASVPGTGVGDCCTKCQQHGGCAAFSWSNFNGGTCWLKNARGTMVPKIGTISGFVSITLTTPAPAPRSSSLPLGYISGGLIRAQTDLPSENGVVGNPTSYPRAGCKQPNYISKNNKIYAVGPNGETEVMAIKGANWFGMETGATMPLGLWYNEQNGSTAYSIAAFLQRNNFNSVRLPLCMESVVKNIAPDTSLYNAAANRAILADTYLNLIKSIVKALAFRQISVLLDIHTLTKNDIGMLWYNDQLSEQTFLQGIDILTQNLCSSEYYNIIGIDLKNEPAWASWGDNNAATDFRAAAVRIGNRMLAGCPKWLAFVEGISENHEFTNSAGVKYNFGDWWGAGLARAKQYPVTLSIPDKVVYAPHFYTPAVWPTEAYYGPNYAELPDALLKENVRTMFDIMFGYLAQDASSPAIVLGEFGGLFALDRHPMKTIQRSVRYMVELLMREGFSGGYVWSLNPESGYDWNPTNTRGFSQEGIVLSDWRYTNEPMLAAFSPLDAMEDLKPLRCFT